MKILQLVLTALGGLTIGVMAGVTIWLDNNESKSNQIKELQIRCHFLEGYKDAYMNHIDKCDTLHVKCFKLVE